MQAQLLSLPLAIIATGLNSFAGFTNTFNASGGTVFSQNLSNNGASYSYGYGLKVGFHSNISLVSFACITQYSKRPYNRGVLV
ncbi:MAG: hypothetical protein L3J22_11270 [Xanthomonadales bacterium]|nr:hypothetical protein [Xanthomonadales bacterium]